MPLFSYNRDIPDAPNSPSADQPLMKTNTNSIDDLIDVDHYSFDEANGGLHRQVRLVNETIPSVSANQVGIYSKVQTQSQIFATSDTGAKEYQLTRFRDADFATFGTYTNAGSTDVNYDQKGGWTFLPGRILFQYATVISNRGTKKIDPSTIPVVFPITFSSSNIIITVTPICKAGGTSEAHVPSVDYSTVSSSGFTCEWDTSTSAYIGFTWTAMGR